VSWGVLALERGGRGDGGTGGGGHTSDFEREAANCLRVAGEVVVVERERMARGVMREDMIECGESLLSGD
jgi:hypothetical protein